MELVVKMPSSFPDNELSVFLRNWPSTLRAKVVGSEMSGQACLVKAMETGQDHFCEGQRIVHHADAAVSCAELASSGNESGLPDFLTLPEVDLGVSPTQRHSKMKLRRNFAYRFAVSPAQRESG